VIFSKCYLNLEDLDFSSVSKSVAGAIESCFQFSNINKLIKIGEHKLLFIFQKVCPHMWLSMPCLGTSSVADASSPSCVKIRVLFGNKPVFHFQIHLNIRKLVFKGKMANVVKY